MDSTVQVKNLVSTEVKLDSAASKGFSLRRTALSTAPFAREF
jgi:hypothetical protein